VVNTLPESVNALPESVNALPESVNALPEAVNALPEAVNALPEAVNALSEAVNALPESVNALPEAVNCLRERVTDSGNESTASGEAAYGLFAGGEAGESTVKMSVPGESARQKGTGDDGGRALGNQRSRPCRPSSARLSHDQDAFVLCGACFPARAAIVGGDVVMNFLRAKVTARH